MTCKSFFGLSKCVCIYIEKHNCQVPPWPSWPLGQYYTSNPFLMSFQFQILIKMRPPFDDPPPRSSVTIISGLSKQMTIEKRLPHLMLKSNWGDFLPDEFFQLFFEYVSYSVCFSDVPGKWFHSLGPYIVPESCTALFPLSAGTLTLPSSKHLRL